MMPDGTVIDKAKLHELKTSAHQQFDGRLMEGCAHRIREAVPGPQWAEIDLWMRQHSNRRLTSVREDHLVRVLLVYATERMKIHASQIYHRILSSHTLHGSLLKRPN